MCILIHSLSVTGKWYINIDPFLHCIYTVLRLLVSAQCKYSAKMGQYLYTTFPVCMIHNGRDFFDLRTVFIHQSSYLHHRPLHHMP